MGPSSGTLSQPLAHPGLGPQRPRELDGVMAVARLATWPGCLRLTVALITAGRWATGSETEPVSLNMFTFWGFHVARYGLKFINACE